jgi:microcystin-dependent protein
MGQPFVGQVIAVGFDFVPQGWLACDGTLLPISEYDVLYTLLGTTYGGDGNSTFGLPDLRGRTAVGAGQGNALSPYVQGQMAGLETLALTAAQAGVHAHAFMISEQAPTASIPAANLAVGQSSQTTLDLLAPPPVTSSLAPAAITVAPGGQQHENRQPFLSVNYLICYAGIFPSQN